MGAQQEPSPPESDEVQKFEELKKERQRQRESEKKEKEKEKEK